MAERHTVAVDVVGSKPIRLPKKESPFLGTLLLTGCRPVADPLRYGPFTYQIDPGVL